jgi:hypothetical protein
MPVLLTIERVAAYYEELTDPGQGKDQVPDNCEIFELHVSTVSQPVVLQNDFSGNQDLMIVHIGWEPP